MVTRAQMIGMLKDAANAIMATLTLVLQLSMSLIEMKPQMDEEEMPPALTHQLETMCQELGRQRHMLQEIVELQKRPPGAALGSPSGTDLLPDPEEDSFSVISYGGKSTELPTTRPSLPAGSNQRALAITGIPVTHVPPTPVEGPQTVTSTMVTKPGSMQGQLTLAQWGQKKIVWGKKHTGKTYYQTLCEDMGYLDWCRARYMSLPPPQKDFVDYCCAQLEHDAVAARQNVPGNQF